jgi:hypothetical protein
MVRQIVLPVDVRVHDFLQQIGMGSPRSYEQYW